MFCPDGMPGTRSRMVVRDRSFSRGTPVCDYWLSRCEGFVVRAGGRTLGVVETVAASDTLGRAEELLVRRRRRGVVVPAEQVLAVVPGRREVLARRKTGRLRAGYVAARPVAAAGARLAALLVRSLTLRLAYESVALVRRVGAQRRRVEQLRGLIALDLQRSRSEDGGGGANTYAFALRDDEVQQPLGRGRGGGPASIPYKRARATSLAR
jgi:hypothetical protein